MTIRFHLDEHINPRIARALERKGIDVTTTVDAGLRTHSDTSQWDYAKSNKRALVTCDRDFLIRTATDSSHFGIIYYPKNANEKPGKIPPHYAG